jgi:hypothetical protein
MTPEHLELLATAFFCNLERKDDCEYGSIGLDCKRPFGNSDVEGDILEIIGVEMTGDDGDGPCWSSNQREYAAGGYNELPAFLRKKYVPKVPERYRWREKYF